MAAITGQKLFEAVNLVQFSFGRLLGFPNVTLASAQLSTLSFTTLQYPYRLINFSTAKAKMRFLKGTLEFSNVTILRE